MFKLGAAVAVLAFAAGSAMAADAVTEVKIDGKNVYNESMYAAPNGDLYFGASGTGNIYRAKKGEATATQFVDGAASGHKSILGVYADYKTNNLYACSVSPRGEPAQPALSALKVFNLRNGKLKMSYPIGAGSTCNDVDISKAGDVYIAETSGGRVLVLKKGTKGGIEEFVVDARLRGIDGLAFIENGDLIANTVTSGRLFAIKPDKTVVELTPSLKPMRGADGMRSSGGNRVLQAESGAGRITEITINGTDAQMRVVKDGIPGTTGVGLVGSTVWINNGKLNDRTPTVTFSAPSVPLGR